MPRIKAAIGVNPGNAGSYSDEVEKALREAASDKSVEAIGSCGIVDIDDAGQVGAFKRQVSLAVELGLVLVAEAPAVASLGPAALGRDAVENALVCMRGIMEEAGIDFSKVLVRASATDPALIAPFIEVGCHVSFDAAAANDPVALCEAVASMPADRVLVESGAPAHTLDVLAGQPGRTDQVVFVADAIQAIVPASQIAANAAALFNVKF